MAVIVEDGSCVEGANSYLSVTDFKTYADARGLSYDGKSDDETGEALIRATSWIDATYRTRFPGVRTYGALQSLQWPRKAGSIVNGQYVPDAYLTTVTDAEGIPIATTEIPSALESGTAEAAYRELLAPNSLAPDLERGGDIRRLKAGSVEVEYSTTAPAATIFTTIDGQLALILVSSPTSPYTARAVRA